MEWTRQTTRNKTKQKQKMLTSLLSSVRHAHTLLHFLSFLTFLYIYNSKPSFYSNYWKTHTDRQRFVVTVTIILVLIIFIILCIKKNGRYNCIQKFKNTHAHSKNKITHPYNSNLNQKYNFHARFH